MKEKKLQNISFIKCTMMLAVVLYHSMLFFSNNWFTCYIPVYKSQIFNYLSMFFNTFHIQTFTMASGFLYFYLKKENNRNIKQNIVKRARRLIIPYLFTCILYVIPICYYFFRYSIKDIFIKYFLMTSPAQLWFLIMLFLIFVFFEFFGKYIKFNKKYFVCIYFFSTIMGLLLSYKNINYFQLSRVFSYILYFYLGGYIYMYNDKVTNKHKNILIMCSFVLLICIFLFTNSNNMFLKYGALLIEPLLSCCEVSLIYIFSTKFIKTHNTIPKTKFFKLLEKTSFGIYLFHQQIIYFVIMLLNGKVYPFTLVLISFVISLTFSLIVTLLFQKNKTLKFLFGL